MAYYPERPSIWSRMIRGLNAHVVDNAEDFERIKSLGFTLVRLDPGGDVPAMLALARAAGLKTMISRTDDVDLGELFRNWQPDYVCIANEPDQKKFWSGSISDLVERLAHAAIFRDSYSPKTKLVFPCVSGLSRNVEAGRFGTKELIQRLSPIVKTANILIGQHVYEDTPDQMLRKFNSWVKLYRKNGWQQKFFVTEFGFRDGQGQDKQATYLVNALSMFSKHPEVAGACVYVYRDDPPENFGLFKASGLAKKAALRLSSSTVTG